VNISAVTAVVVGVVVALEPLYSKFLDLGLITLILMYDKTKH
jgi:hypothetical protein